MSVVNSKMRSEALNCPNCGAPLRVSSGQSMVLCLYCDTSVRVTRSESAPTLGVAVTSIPPGTVRQVKQLLLAGQRAQAVALYRQAVGGDAREAEKAVEALAGSVSLNIMRGQRLTFPGVFMVCVFTAILVWSVYAGLTGGLPPAYAIVLAAFALILIWPFARAPWTTLRYLSSSSAAATVLRIAPIGQIKTIHAFRLLVEVRPADGNTFQAEMNLPVREKSLAQVQTGLRLQVRYFPGDPNSLIFDRVIST